MIINNDDSHNNLINSVIDTVYQLKCSKYSANRWMTGIDASIFREEYQLVEPGNAGDESVVRATFDITIATETQKKDFVAQCIQAYRLTIAEPNQLIWKTFQTYLINQLQILRKFLIIRNLHNTNLRHYIGNLCLTKLMTAYI